MATQIYKVRDPSGAIREIEGPAGATDDQVISKAKELFAVPAAPTGGIPMGRQVAPEQTMTQKVYQAVRPYVAPLVEAGGAIGGGVLGAGAGTLGAGPVGTAVGGIAGAGLGYGMGKELMQLADVSLGGQAPRVGAAQVTEPLRNIAEGATMEVGGQLAGKALGYAAGKVADLRQLPLQKATGIAQKALGADLPEVLNALRTAPPTASVAQLTAKIQNPAWQSLIKDALEKDPQFVRKAQLLSERESRNALAQLAGGTTAADIRAATETGKQALTSLTTPMRETALSRANLGKAVADYEAQAGKLTGEAAAKVADVRRLVNAGNLAEASARLDLIKQGIPVAATKYTYKGELGKMADAWATGAANASLDLGQGARFAQGAADSLRSVGIKPLEGTTLAQSIANVANKPEFAGNDLIAGAAKNVAEDIAKWTSSGGVVDAKALDAIRKNSVNAAIQQLRPGADATTQRNLAAGVLSKIKPVIDDAIESAGGEGYKQYLSNYAKGMTKLNEQKLTGEAARLWKTDKDAFVRLVQNESPDVVEKFLGPGNYNIATELADNAMSVLQKQAEKRLTELSVKEQVSEGGAALTQLLKQETSRFRFPSFLSFWASAGNKTLSELEQRLGTKTMSQLTDAMKTPQGAANLLETLSGNERNRIIQLLSNPQQWKPGAATTGAAAINMLAPASENQNALAGQ